MSAADQRKALTRLSQAWRNLAQGATAPPPEASAEVTEGQTGTPPRTPESVPQTPVPGESPPNPRPAP